jgi:hypothetical protein
VNISNSGREEPIRGGPSAWGLGEVLRTPHHKKLIVLTKYCKKPRNQTDSLVRPIQVVGSCEYGDEPLGSKKCGEFPG